MNIQDFIENAVKLSQTRTPEERANLLKKANILDKNGYYSEKYFSSETVLKDKSSSKPKAQ
jgi:hypothetical protein